MIQSNLDEDTSDKKMTASQDGST